MKKKIILSVTNDLSRDQRVHRIASTLVEAGYAVEVIGRRLPTSSALQQQSYKVERMRLLFHKGPLFYLSYNLRLLFKLLFTHAEVLNANDLDTLWANYWASKITGKRLVYDAHELFTEVPELVGRDKKRKIWEGLEKRRIPKLKWMYTVNGSLAEIYKNKYGVNCKIIRNLPLPKPMTREIRRPGKILLYQGALNLGRGIELMIQAMQHLPEFKLWICGTGDVEAQLQTLCDKLNLKDRVEFKGSIPFEELHAITRQASLGFSLEEDIGLNYHYASPNKVYDYIQARVPCLVAELPEMKKVVEEHKVGEVLGEKERTPEQLATRVKSIIENTDQWVAYSNACVSAAATLNWEAEKETLLAIYADASA